MAEYIEGYSEDIWSHEAYLIEVQLRIEQLSAAKAAAEHRRGEGGNPFGVLVASVASRVYERRLNIESDRLSYALELTS